jgi:hypothetical protein
MTAAISYTDGMTLPDREVPNSLLGLVRVPGGGVRLEFAASRRRGDPWADGALVGWGDA